MYLDDITPFQENAGRSPQNRYSSAKISNLYLRFLSGALQIIVNVNLIFGLSNVNIGKHGGKDYAVL